VQLGDLPGIGMTIIDGIVRTQRSRNTPPATRLPEIVGRARDCVVSYLFRCAVQYPEQNPPPA
jgi:hypothetical protein